MLKSIRAKLYALFLLMVSVLVLLTLLLNTILLPKYYQSQREDVLRDSYIEIVKAIYDRSNTDLTMKLGAIESKNSVRIYITDRSLRIIYGISNRYFMYSGETISIKSAFGDETSVDGVDTQYSTIEVHYDSKTDLKYLALTSFLEYQNDYYNVSVDTTVEAINESIQISNTFLIYSTLFTLVIAGVAFYFLSRKFVKPIQEINTVAKKITVLDFSEKLKVKSKDEVGQLSESVNQLSSQLESKITDLQRANMQLKLDLFNRDKTDQMRKEFISNVSHELKTPIALILGYAEGLKVGIN